MSRCFRPPSSRWTFLRRGRLLLLRLALGTDTFQQDRGRLVVRVLGHQVAGEGLLQDALAQPLGTLQAGIHRRFRLLDDPQPPLHLGHYTALLDEGRERDGQSADFADTQRVRTAGRTGNTEYRSRS